MTPDQTWSVNGNVQKGPFTQGTSITIQALDESLNPTGKNYSTKTTDDAGSFSIDNKIESRYVEIIAQGYYFNEIEGRVSASMLTLRSLSDLQETGKTNVNLLTTLEADRIKTLVKTGKSFADARQQAEKDIFAVFNIPNAVNAAAGFDKMDITKGTEADGILLAISASLQAGRTVGELSELISKIAGEVSTSGKVESELIKNKIIEGCQKVDAEAVRNNLKARYADLGISDFSIPPFEDYLDVDGNGVIDKKDSWIILGQSEFVVSDEGGSFELSLKHNIDYEVIIEGANWLAQHGAPGTKAYLEDVTLYFTAQANNEPEERYAIIKIKDKASSRQEQAKVTQKQKDALTVSASTFELEKEGGSFNITLGFNNPDATLKIDVPWLRKVGTKAMQTIELSFEADANPEVETREGHIIFEGGKASEVVTVYQKGGRSIILSAKEIKVGPEAGQVINIQASANVDFEVLGPYVDWLQATEDAPVKAVVSNNYSYTVSENTTGESRQAVILFKDKESDLSESVTIVQEQNDIMNCKGEYRIPYEGGSVEIKLESNVDYTPSIEQEGNWLSIVSTKALRSSSVTLKAEKNESVSPRTAHLILASGNKGWSIAIVQRGNAQQVTVNVASPGSLSSTISEDELHKIINLKITGTLNNQDLSLLSGGWWNPGSNLAGQQGPHIECDWCVEELDLSEMRVEENIIGKDMQFFGYIPSLVKVKMPIHLETVGTDCFKKCENLEILDFGSDSEILTICGAVKAKGAIAIGQNRYFGAFESCISLKEVTLPANLEKFHAGAFINCSALERVVFPETCKVRNLQESFDYITTGLTNRKVSMGHFRGCSSLETVVLPKSLRKIGEGAFSGTPFRRIEIPETVTEIHTSDLFYSCYRLEEVTLPAIISEYSEYMFAGCQNLKKINCKSVITKYGNHCFDGANSAFLKLDAGIEYGKYVFANMEDLESIEIPEGFTSIPEGMFSGCNNLTTIKLGKVTTIGESAFAETAVENLVLPASVREVHENAFANCRALKNLEILSERIVFNSSFGGCENFTELKLGKNIISAKGSLAASFLKEISFEEGSRCEEFGIAAYTAIKSISLPKSIKRITESAFAQTQIRNIELPENLEYIGAGAFNGTELRSFIVPEKVDTIETGAFAYCQKLSDFSIPSNSRLKYIGENVFEGCESLDPFILNGAEELSINANVLNYSNLKGITIGKSIRKIKGSSYNSYSEIKDFKCEEGSVLEEICGKAFAKDAKVALPASLKVIGDSVFEQFTGTLNADFSNLVSIGDKAFRKSTLEDLSFAGEKLQNIGSEAFSRCNKLSNLYLNGAKTLNIGQGALSSYSGKLTIGKNIEKLVCANGNGVANFECEEGSVLEEICGRGLFAQGTKVALPASLKVIGDSVFEQFTGTLNADFSNLVSIGDKAFLESTLEDLSFAGDKLQNIGSEAFSRCNKLSNLYLNGAKTLNIGQGALQYYSGKLTIGKNIEKLVCANGNGVANLECEEGSNLKEIVGKMWANDASINLPPSLEIIGDNMFQNFKGSFVNSTFPNVRSIAKYAFESAKVTNLSFPNVSTIAEYAFRNSTLEHIDMPNVITIGGCAFEDAKVTNLSFPNVSTIAECAFRYSTLEHIDMPNVITIGDYAFSACKSIGERLDLPKIESIGTGAFSVSESGIKYLSLGKDFKTFGSSRRDSLFGGLLKEVLEIRFTGQNPPTIGTKVLSGEFNENFKILVPSEYYPAYIQTWKGMRWATYIQAE